MLQPANVRSYLSLIHISLTAERIMEGLKTTGRMAENAMYASTGGINTHKGINYSMGLLCAAIGICIEAVSYTHLDVYKRQLPARAG